MPKGRILFSAIMILSVLASALLSTAVAGAVTDTTPPVVSNVVPANGSTIYANGGSTVYYMSGNATPTVIRADYSDETGGSGVDPNSIMVHLDGGNMLSDCPVQTASHVDCNATASDLYAGAHTLDIYVMDNAGHLTVSHTTLTVSVDNQAPTYSNLSPTGGSTIYTSQLNSTSTNDPGALRFDYDIADAAPSSGYSPMSHVNDTLPPSVPGAMIMNSSCVKTPATNPTHYSCQVNRAQLLHLGENTLSAILEDNVGNGNDSDPSSVTHYTVVDDVDPVVSGVTANASTIAASYADPAPTGTRSTNLVSGISTASLTVEVDGIPVPGCSVSGTGVNCATPAGLAAGSHSVAISANDNAGNMGSSTGSFDIAPPSASRNYYWTWYDNVNMQNWVLMANPSGSGKTLDFSLSVEDAPQDLAPFAISGQPAGVVPEGKAITPIISGLMGGPVKVTSNTGDKAIVSQRSVMGNSFEEVLGTDAGKLSDNFWWTWYDQLNPGLTNWVLVANPSESESVHAVISFTNQADGARVASESDIAPGKNWTPTFPGKMGGPVEVRAYRAGGSWDTVSDRRNVIASERVLSNNGSAFNEVPGIPAGELSNDYLWTWYDSVGALSNSILVGNPNQAGGLWYRITIGTTDYGCQGPVGQNQVAWWNHAGVQTGPVELRTYSNSGCTVAADAVATQRVIWGPSFEEVPGYPQAALGSTYHWTWYDDKYGMNWVLVGNPSAAETVTAEITFTDRDSGLPVSGTYDIAPGQNVFPRFTGKMGGPVKVSAHLKDNPGSPRPVIASQRALWNGYFNEVLGTVLQ